MTGLSEFCGAVNGTANTAVGQHDAESLALILALQRAANGSRFGIAPQCVSRCVAHIPALILVGCIPLVWVYNYAMLFTFRSVLIEVPVNLYTLARE